MADLNERLFAEFPPVSVADWEAKILEDLKGADYEKRLVWKTLEEFRVKPYYCADDLKNIKYPEQVPGKFGIAPGNKVTSNLWEIRQDFRMDNVETTNTKARLAAERGVTSVGFDLKKQNDITAENFQKLLSGIDFNAVSLNLLVNHIPLNLADILAKSLTDLSVDAKKIKGSVDFDPLGNLAVTGGYYESEEKDFAVFTNLVKESKGKLPEIKSITVNGQNFGNAGASAVQEIAFSLAMASEYISYLTDNGFTVKDILSHVQLNLSVGSNYFLEIAKIRAIRHLWAYLIKAFDKSVTDEASVFIQSINTSWNKTIYDPYVNLLRATTEAMAAVLGGTDSLLIQPFDSYFREPGDFSERIARNIQIILKEESYLDRVVDPAAGSYYIESLTDALCENAWNLFLKVDEQGGFSKGFKAGFIQNEIKNTFGRRKQMVATRKEFLLGTNQYPNAKEQVKDQIEAGIAFPSQQISEKQVAEPLKIDRAATEFEKLRLAAENRKSGKPKVFMLTHGNLAMRLARSQFSCNFFACGGYEIIDNLGFKTAEEGVNSALKVKADIIVICSSDDEYAVFAPAVFELAKNKSIIVVAGAPSCMEELKQKGIEHFIHVRSNVLETLTQFHIKLRINI